MTLDKLTAVDFHPYLNQPFQIFYAPTKFIDVELIEVSENPEFTVLSPRKTFTLIFRSDSKTHYLPQGVFRVVHEKMEPLDILVIPLGPDQVGMKYQSIFN